MTFKLVGERGIAGLALLLGITACTSTDPVALTDRQGLALDGDNEDGIQPASNYTLFEADPVRPIAVLGDTGLVAVANVPDDYVELFRSKRDGLEHCGSIKVGMRPVALALIKGGTKHNSTAELWVINHLSDSINVVEVDIKRCTGQVSRTIAVGDEPRDIVVAKTPAGPRVLVTVAHRGQNHPDPVTASGVDLITPVNTKARQGRPTGLADVLVFDPKAPNEAPTILNLFTDVPRALALGPTDVSGYHNTVYAAGFLTGNKTTVIDRNVAANRGRDSLLALIESGAVVEGPNGDFEVAQPGARFEGGDRATVGMGRCIAETRAERRQFGFFNQLCIETDANHGIIAIHEQNRLGAELNTRCSCTSFDGTLQPTVGLMVQEFTGEDVCGPGVETCWLDADPTEFETSNTPAGDKVIAPPLDWTDFVAMDLPDEDIFAIHFDDHGVPSVRRDDAVAGVGTVLFNMVTHPKTGELYVTNLDSHNLTRFEGAGEYGSTTVRGDLVRSRISTIDGGQVQHYDLNDHVDHAQCCEDDAVTNAQSIAFPTGVTITTHRDHKGKVTDDQRIFFAAMGSDKIGWVSTETLRGTAGAEGSGVVNDVVEQLSLTDGERVSGPVGLTLSRDEQRLYVLSRFTNELIEIDIDRDTPQIVDRHVMPNPEPASITDGRHLLYNASLTSSKGDQACASCHIFSNFDGLAWDLGDPDLETVENPGPFVISALEGIVGRLRENPLEIDPILSGITPDFRALKGPMSTQSLRGMANQGPMHWRGDRTRRFQEETGEQPNTGSLNEDNSFGEFDVAVVGLNGRANFLEAETFQLATNFTLQLTYPPNPVRKLDNALTEAQTRARALYFGCSEMSDEQFEQRTCLDQVGNEVAVDAMTAVCGCSVNQFVHALQRVHTARALGQGLATLDLETLELIPDELDPTHELEATILDSLAALQPLGSDVADLFEVPLASLARPGSVVANTATAQVFGLESLDVMQSLIDGTGTDEGGFLAVLDTIAGIELELSNLDILGPLMAAMELSGAPAEQLAGLQDPASVAATLESTLGELNLARMVVFDAQAVGGQVQDVLHGCAEDIQHEDCTLRVTDGFTTCQGCHRLDPDANAEFDVFRPGFFGTGGEYSFETISQIFKVPHLRNAYAKTGMFGRAVLDPQAILNESIFGLKAGGFEAPRNGFAGEQVRGVSFLHDGSIGEVHRFLGGLVFVARPAGTISSSDGGSPDAPSSFLPADPNACLSFTLENRDAFIGQLEGAEALAPVAGAALNGDATAAATVVESVLGQAGSLLADERWAVVLSYALEDLETDGTVSSRAATLIVKTVASSLLCPDLPESAQPLCFQLGSTLELGSETGICYPTGQAERAELEDFTMAFDSNLKPMVGQQITINSPELDPRFDSMFRSAAAGHCDIGGIQKGRGFVVTSPNGQDPISSQVLRDDGTSDSLYWMITGAMYFGHSTTLTCYPPQLGQAEAIRSVLDRDADGVFNDDEHDDDEHGGHGHDHP